MSAYRRVAGPQQGGQNPMHTKLAGMGDFVFGLGE